MPASTRPQTPPKPVPSPASGGVLQVWIWGLGGVVAILLLFLAVVI